MYEEIAQLEQEKAAQKIEFDEETPDIEIELDEEIQEMINNHIQEGKAKNPEKHIIIKQIEDLMDGGDRDFMLTI